MRKLDEEFHRNDIVSVWMRVWEQGKRLWLKVFNVMMFLGR